MGIVNLRKGGYYKDRSGIIHGPLVETGHHLYSLRGDNRFVAWMSNGRFDVSAEDPKDLIKEVPAPEPAPAQKKPSPRWLKKVRRELAKLDNRTARLAVFQTTHAFGDLSPEHQMWLRIQLSAMGIYREALKRRVRLGEDQREMSGG